MKPNGNLRNLLPLLAAAALFVSCGRQTKQEATALPDQSAKKDGDLVKDGSGDDQPITVSGGSIKLENASKASWKEVGTASIQVLTYAPTNKIAAKLGQIRLQGTDGNSGKKFDFLARRDPATDLHMEVIFGPNTLGEPTTLVLVESSKNPSSATRDEVTVSVVNVGLKHHKFIKYTNLLHQIEEPGWGIEKVILNSGLIAVPNGAPPLPLSIDVMKNDFTMRLHHCTLDPKKADGSCAP